MLKQIKNGLIHWITFVLIIWIAWVWYSAWQTNVESAVAWTALTATKYNQLVDRLAEIDQQQLATAWVNFDGTNCPLTWWEYLCDINWYYNIDKVVKTSNWKYIIYFNTWVMENVNYIISWTANWNSTWNSWLNYRNDIWSKTITSVWVSTYSSAYYNSNDVMVVFHWGKN